MIAIWRSSPNRAAYFSATAITTSRENFSASPTWPGRSNASPRSQMISTMVLLRGNSQLPCKRAVA